MADSGENAKGFEFRKFATPRIIGGIAIVVIVLWALTIIFDASNGTGLQPHSDRQDTSAVTSHNGGGHDQAVTTERSPMATESATAHKPAKTAAGTHSTEPERAAGQTGADSHAMVAKDAADHGAAPKTADAKAASNAATHRKPAAVEEKAAPSDSHGASPTDGKHSAATAQSADVGAPAHKPAPKGVAFVEATISPLKYELEERWWGWRPNDIMDVTDNVNNFQMGVLEVTRRTAVALAERISRTGVTDALDPNLEDAMNWFMVKASSYWFPSAESKYREGLQELEAYLKRLREGRATFYTRTDNLIPLLSSFEDLLGSCDENLVKQIDEDGEEVSFFTADDYFYYTQGVATSMATVLEAVHHDFLLTLESRHGTELLHHAIVSCQKAAELDPWIILDRDLSSVFANHRANMAAPISHARFYIGQLIKTLST